MLEHAVVQIEATYADKRKFEVYMQDSPEWVGWTEEDPDELLEQGKEVLFCRFKSLSDLVISGHGSCLSFDVQGIGWYEAVKHHAEAIRFFATELLSDTYFKYELISTSREPSNCLFFLLVKSWVDVDSFEIQDLRLITAEALVGRLFHG